MAPLTKAAAPLARAWTRHSLANASRAAPALKTTTPVAALSTSHARADLKANLETPSSRPIYSGSDVFDTPFDRSGGTARETTSVPDFTKYKSGRGELSNKMFQYFMVGTMGAVTAMGAKATVQDFLVNMSASADVLAQAKVEIDLSTIPEGKNVIIKWRGKPVFIRHRTESEISEANDIKWESLRDPQPDSDRVQKPEWLVMVGVCTHLGCVPIGEAGDYGGWFCPCHGSHYDISGRVRRGPAPLNLEVPGYQFPEENSLIIG